MQGAGVSGFQKRGGGTLAQPSFLIGKVGWITDPYQVRDDPPETRRLFLRRDDG